MKNKFVNENIIIDKSEIDSYVLEMIQTLEKYDEEGDDFNYDFFYPRLEMCVKFMLSKNKISESTYNKILKKYGGYCD